MSNHNHIKQKYQQNKISQNLSQSVSGSRISLNGYKFQRRRYFQDSAKIYIASVQNDQQKKQQFKTKYQEHIQKIQQAKKLYNDKMIEQKMKKRFKLMQKRQLMINKKIDPCRVSLRILRNKQSLESSELDEEANLLEPSKSLANNQTEMFFKFGQNQSLVGQKGSVIQIQEKALKLQQEVKKQVFYEQYEQNSEVFQSKLNGKDQAKSLKQMTPIEVEPVKYTIEHLPHADRNLLKIQQKIDKFIIYNRQTRLRPYVYIDQLINYINQSENYFFNRGMFQKLQTINKDLYLTQQGLTKQTLLVRGKQLSDQTIKSRIECTFNQLIKSNFGSYQNEAIKQQQTMKVGKHRKGITKNQKKDKKRYQFNQFNKRILRSKDCVIVNSLEKCFKKISNN